MEFRISHLRIIALSDLFSINSIYFIHKFLYILKSHVPFQFRYDYIIIKGAVSYRFSQGLLTLMCNNSELKTDINFFFFLLRRQTS